MQVVAVVVVSSVLPTMALLRGLHIQFRLVPVALVQQEVQVTETAPLGRIRSLEVRPDLAPLLQEAVALGLVMGHQYQRAEVVEVHPMYPLLREWHRLE